mmetsp:Transcript_11747/g.25680  ORF Transcript_11747/g.25680 Transcript_11747/m.25680 type:complete len:231 (+) Transcript_11747:161-853(+)
MNFLLSRMAETLLEPNPPREELRFFWSSCDSSKATPDRPSTPGPPVVRRRAGPFFIMSIMLSLGAGGGERCRGVLRREAAPRRMPSKRLPPLPPPCGAAKGLRGGEGTETGAGADTDEGADAGTGGGGRGGGDPLPRWGECTRMGELPLGRSSLPPPCAIARAAGCGGREASPAPEASSAPALDPAPDLGGGGPAGGGRGGATEEGLELLTCRTSGEEGYADGGDPGLTG